MPLVPLSNGSVAQIALTLDNGTDLAAKIDPRFIELSLVEKRGGEADELHITLHNADGKLAVPRAGIYLRLSLGWASLAVGAPANIPMGMVDKGRFKVDEVGQSGPPDIVTIIARSAALSGSYAKRRSRVWHDTTLGMVLSTIAARHGATATVHPDFMREPIDGLEQNNKSDMAFVHDLGRRYDALATWKNKRLVFMPMGSATTAGGKIIPERTLTRQNGWTWSYTRAERSAANGVQAQYHDAGGGVRKSVTVGGTDAQRLKHVYASKSSAKRAAKSNLAKRLRGKSKFDYSLAVADPTLHPNGKIALKGWGDAVASTKWLIESVETKLGASGMTQELKFEGA
jgi:phage protein D